MATATKTVETSGYTEEDAYRDFYVKARNERYTGETEGFQFVNGMAKVIGIPKSVKCSLIPSVCAKSDDPCRVHDRVRHLNGVANYPYTFTERRGDRRVPVTVPTYTVLTQEQYDASGADGEVPEDL